MIDVGGWCVVDPDALDVVVVVVIGEEGLERHKKRLLRTRHNG